jgi:iron(II)-dependent oxidoreductase
MLTDGRYALLLRPQIAENLEERQFQRASEALEAGMALVPDGEVVLPQMFYGAEVDGLEDGDLTDFPSRVVPVEHFFLDRHPVTNRQFYSFVVDGGYEQAPLWHESILPQVLDFVDATGVSGPAFWINGCYPPGREDHPVVGVSWFEAAAYARWQGKRLPTDAEWAKAGSWPVKLSTVGSQRKYPWGNSMDYARTNLWRSGLEDTVPVTEFVEGASVGGVYQLIGNVWEWTLGDFPPRNSLDETLIVEVPMKSIHGGAFDTYFDNQATCDFQSGESPLARKPNIGFRCAVGGCDLRVLSPGSGSSVALSEIESAIGHEEERR